MTGLNFIIWNNKGNDVMIFQRFNTVRNLRLNIDAANCYEKEMRRNWSREDVISYEFSMPAFKKQNQLFV